MFNVPMALVDYIPVVLFCATMVVLQHDLYYQFAKWQFALFAGGGIMVFTAGFYKATWKLLYALAICDFEKLNQIFFPMQATGFLLVGFAAVALLTVRQKKAAVTLSAAAPAVFGGTMLFVAGMILGVLGLCASLAVIAGRMKKKGAVALFWLAFVLMLGMGYLSSKDFSQAYMNWVAQAINVAGQLCLLLGARVLDKAGLRSFQVRKDA